ncbi:MAG: ammonium transporter [Christensenella sp.]|nr:ammonium transporter [Christensenella sp.]
MFSSVDTVWVLLGAALVFFMQAGFAMVETGLTRAKNAGNIIMKNLMDFSLGSVVFWVIGFGLMFGVSASGLIGTPDFFVQNEYLVGDIPPYVFFIFQTMFCATAATIVSGAMAERTKFSTYCIYSLIISAVIYPISGHWIWGGGWLSSLGFHDFAGSTAVHMVGGVAALVGAMILGPRIGKYDKNGKSKAILGHSIPLAALGVFILWFAWFGFNGCSTLSIQGDSADWAGKIFTTTSLSASAGAIGAMFITWIRYKKPDVSMTLNGALAGLVGITAGCDAVDPWAAFVIGLICSFVVVFGVELLDKKLKIDDPVGAIPVHGFCGAVGTILVGIFAIDGGLLYTGDPSFLGVQVIGVLAVIAWVAITMTIVFQILKHTIGLRVSKSEELTGLDIEEHGLATGYADFMPANATGFLITENGTNSKKAAPASVTPLEQAVPVARMPKTADGMPSGDTKMTKLVVISNQNKFGDLKTALEDIGITGITVSQVMGAGMQKGHSEYYRGVEVDINLLPKIKVEIVVCKIPVEVAVEAIKKALYTGHIGDGKIFIYDVENVIKVRTGEEGYDALQDEGEMDCSN